METMYTNDESSGREVDTNGTDESGIISDLSLTAEVPVDVELNAEKNQQQLNEPNESNENVRIAEQNHELMQILSRRDTTIKNMSTVLNHMETQLQFAVSAKLDALARLEKIEGKELTLRFKEQQMGLDAERVSKNIENLTENLNKTMALLAAVRKEQASASAEFEIELKRKCEQLRMANVNVCKLSETNQKLKTQNEKYAYKLQQQLDKSDKLIESYDKELKAKTELAELHQQNRADYQAHVEELTAALSEMRKFLDEVVDGHGLLETELNAIQLDRKAESDEKDGIIGKLKQELEDANRLLKAYHNDDDKSDIKMDGELIDSPISNNRPVVKEMTVTEMYSQYCSVVKELQLKEQEYEILEGEMKNLINDVTEKAIQFKEQQDELINLKAIKVELIDERKDSVAIKMVSLMEKENNRSRCELLTAENNELKSIMKCYETDCLKQLFSMPNNRSIIAKLAHPATVELEQQNQQLLVVVQELIAKIQEMNSVEVLASEIYEVRGADENTACHKSVQVAEDELMTERNSCTRDIPNVKSHEAKIDELSQKNTKLQAEVQKLRQEKNLLVAEANLFNIRSNARENQIQTLEARIQNHATLINESNIANKFLRDANANVTMKLSTVENQLLHLQNENRSLSERKQSLIAEVETLRRDLAQQEIANKVVSDATSQTETGIESHEESTSAINSPDVFVIMMGENQSTAAETPKPNRFKRTAEECNAGESGSSSTSTGCSKRLRSKTKPRVEFVDLPEDEIEIINVCDDEVDVLPTAELQLLSEVRTRKQAKFIRDAFHNRNGQSIVNVKLEPLDDEKVSQPKRARNSARGRSHSSRGSRSSTRADRAQSSSRSRSIGYQQSSVFQQSDNRSNGQQIPPCGNQNEVVINRRSRRLMSRSRRAIVENKSSHNFHQSIKVTNAGDGNDISSPVILY